MRWGLECLSAAAVEPLPHAFSARGVALLTNCCLLCGSLLGNAD